jgi:hypothetical protein
MQGKKVNVGADIEKNDATQEFDLDLGTMTLPTANGTTSATIAVPNYNASDWKLLQ